jgi:hypothetical protein
MCLVQEKFPAQKNGKTVLPAGKKKAQDPVPKMLYRDRNCSGIVVSVS